MPNLRDIRRRISSVEKTQQITSAMRMVAAAKLRRAQESIEAARPYAERMRNTLSEVAASQTDAAHPLLVRRESVEKVEFVVVTSDRGLAGAFNANVLKRAEAMMKKCLAAGQTLEITTAGRKASEHYRRHRPDQLVESYELGGWISYDQAAHIGRRIIHRYEAGEVDEVVLVYSEFVSILTQRPVSHVLVPLAAAESAELVETAETSDLPPHEIEPDAEKLLALMAPTAVEVALYRALLENQAGEHAARMTAMENATRNTKDLIERLTLEFNRARQAAITSELVEIVTGAQAVE